jgi:uncharacterized phage protein (TIGR02218 family)
MKTIPAALLTHIEGGDCTTCKCWKATRTDGEVYGFTEHDRDLVVSGVTYKAATGVSASALKTGGDFSVPNSDIEGAFDAAAITEDDIGAGLWDNCAIECFRVNWAAPTDGVEKLGSGVLGEVRMGRQQFVAELQGLMRQLAQQVCELYSPSCRADLGDARCKVRLDPPAWAAATAYTVRRSGDAGTGSVVKPAAYNGRHFKCTTAGTSGGSEPAWNTTIGATTADGSVVWTALQALTVEGAITAVDDRVTFYDTSRTEADDFFGGGKITFTSGLNAGIAREIKSYTLATGQIVLQRPMPYDVAVSDTYEMTAGCRFRGQADCRQKFDNMENHRAEELVPGTNFLLTGGL